MAFGRYQMGLQYNFWASKKVNQFTTIWHLLGLFFHVFGVRFFLFFMKYFKRII